MKSISFFFLSELSFALTVTSDSPDCNSIDHFDEGVEVAMGNWNNAGQWIPLAIYVPNFERSNFDNNMGEILNETFSIANIRGYQVPVYTSETFSVSLNVCTEDLVERDNVQFRWLQTANFMSGKGNRDVWTLDDVNITLHLSVKDAIGTVLFKDDFNNQDTVK